MLGDGLASHELEALLGEKVSAPVHDVAVVVETPLCGWRGPARGVVVRWVGALLNFEVGDLFD